MIAAGSLARCITVPKQLKFISFERSFCTCSYTMYLLCIGSQK